jgi:uncharacterized membrane protein
MRLERLRVESKECITMDPDQRHGNDFYWQQGAHHAHDGWWSGPLHAIIVLLLLALLVAGVVWLVRRLSPAVATQAAVSAAAPAAAMAADPAVAALRMRYARGEVSRDDFQHAMEDLTGATSALPGSTWPGGSPGEDTAPTAS